MQDITNFQAFNAYALIALPTLLAESRPEALRAARCGRLREAESQRANQGVQSNPLSCSCASDAHPHPRVTDPSGFFLKGLFKAIGSVFRGIGRVFAHAAKAIARSSIGRAILQIVACANPAAAFTCAPAAAGLTLLAGGTLKQAFISAALAFVQVGASNGGIIDIWGKVGDAVVLSGTGPVGTALSHGVVSGAISMAQGGSFVSGFMSGAVAGGVGEISGGLGEAGQFTATVVAGGTASVLSGGKFANGAITGAFAQLYNAEAGPEWYKKIRQQHLDGVRQASEYYNSLPGWKVLTEPGAEIATYVAGFDTPRFYDLLVQDPQGAIVGIEVKTSVSNDLRLDPHQVDKDVAVQLLGGRTTTGLSVSRPAYYGVGFISTLEAGWSGFKLESRLKAAGVELQTCGYKGCSK
ncbi:MAG: hypothetical protein R3D51_17910 [Hyphomicrobiaceae bacterium]